MSKAMKVCEDGECWYEVDVDSNSDENTIVNCRFCGDTYVFKGLESTSTSYQHSPSSQTFFALLMF